MPTNPGALPLEAPRKDTGTISLPNPYPALDAATSLLDLFGAGGYGEFLGPAPKADALGKDLSGQVISFNSSTLTRAEESARIPLEESGRQVAETVKASDRQIMHVIDEGQRKIVTNAIPVLGTLDAITTGASSLASLNDAQVVALITSMDRSLEFLQASRQAQANERLSGILAEVTQGPTRVISGVSGALSAVASGLVDAIQKVLTKIEALILDPIAALLRAILAAILTLPDRIGGAVWDQLLAEQHGLST